MAPVGAWYLQKENGGKGLLLAGAPGVKPGRVVVLGAGTVGNNAVRIAVGMGAEVTVLESTARASRPSTSTTATGYGR